MHPEAAFSLSLTMGGVHSAEQGGQS
ncbi:hypothetical protein LCGC14_3040220, partial [marine sediment metagenome]